MKDFKTKLKKLLNRIWPVLVALLLVVIFFWKFFFKGLIPIPGDFIVGVYYPWLDYKWGTVTGVPVKNPILSDVVSFSYPMRALAVEELKDGIAPLWNPYILTGIPLLANFQSAPFAITNLLYFIFNNYFAWSLQVIVQHFFVISFTYVLLRSWKVSRLSSLAGGLIYSFSGFNLIWSQWNAHTLTAAFLPLLILFTDKYLLTGKTKYGLLLSVAICLQLFSGYPQVVLYSFIALSLLWLTRIFYVDRKIFRTFTLGLFVVLGISLASVQLMPGWELLSLSQRSIEINSYKLAFLPLEKIITFIAPDYFGNHATGNYWGPQDYTSNVGFVGIIALLLFMLPLTKKLKPNLKFVYILSLVSFFISISNPLTRFIWSTGFLGLNAASAHRVLVLWNFGAGLGAAYGMDLLFKNNRNVFKLSTIPLFVLLSYFFAAVNPNLFKFLLKDATHPEIPQIALIAQRNLIFPLIVLACFLIVRLFSKYFGKNIPQFLTLALMTTELFRFGWKYTPFSPSEYFYPATPVINFLENREGEPFRVTGTEVIPMNIRMEYGLESPEGYDAVYPQAIAKLFAAIGSSSADASSAGRYGFIDDVGSPIVGLMNTKYLLALKKDHDNKPSADGEINNKYLNSKYEKVFTDKSVCILKDSSASPRAFMYYDYLVADSQDTLKALLTSRDLRKTIYLDKDPGIVPQAGENSVNYKKINNNSTEINVYSQGAGILFVSDNYYPGWNVYVDGKQKEMLRANYTFRGVAVSNGNHKIEFKYESNYFINGLKISIGSLVLLCIIWLLSSVMEKRKAGKYT